VWVVCKFAVVLRAFGVMSILCCVFCVRFEFCGSFGVCDCWCVCVFCVRCGVCYSLMCFCGVCVCVYCVLRVSVCVVYCVILWCVCVCVCVCVCRVCLLNYACVKWCVCEVFWGRGCACIMCLVRSVFVCWGVFVCVVPCVCCGFYDLCVLGCYVFLICFVLCLRVFVLRVEFCFVCYMWVYVWYVVFVGLNVYVCVV